MVVSLPDLMLLGGERKFTTYLLLLLLELFLEGAESVTNAADIKSHVEMGKQLLARNQLSDALTHFHAAVEGDPTDYLTLYSRGTVYFALGRARFAADDFTRVLELKPDFTAARLHRGEVYMKTGDYHLAAEDFSVVLQENPHHEVAKTSHSRIKPAIEQWEIVEELIKRGDNHNSIQMLTQLIEISPWCVKYRQTRAEAYIANKDMTAAVSDLRSVNRLSQDSTEGYFRLASILYKIGDVSSCLDEIRECLRLDPEHKSCFPFYKKLKKVKKNLDLAEAARDEKQYKVCIEKAEKALNDEKEEPMVKFEAKRLLCTCYVRDQQFAESLEYCNRALKINEDAQIYCDRAEAYLGSEMYDDAIHDYKKAKELDETLQRAKDGLEKAQRLQKQAEKRDYYKILDVKRTATKQEITKAYRKAAQKWHPDNFQGDQKKIAEKKFIDIAAAKEVLTDPEKRRQFDNGQDPLDPEAQQGGHGFRDGSPFQHFHHGSPFQFKFHFN